MYKQISLKKIYDVIRETETDYRIINDSGDELFYKKELFKVVSEDININIVKENLLNAYHRGCGDVQRTLKTLFPDIDFNKKKKVKVWMYVYMDINKNIFTITYDANNNDPMLNHKILDIIEKEYEV